MFVIGYNIEYNRPCFYPKPIMIFMSKLLKQSENFLYAHAIISIVKYILERIILKLDCILNLNVQSIAVLIWKAKNNCLATFWFKMFKCRKRQNDLSNCIDIVYYQRFHPISSDKNKDKLFEMHKKLRDRINTFINGIYRQL